MTSPIEFTVAKRPATEPIPFTLEGTIDRDPETGAESEHVFQFTPPKEAAGLMAILTSDMEDINYLHFRKGQLDWLSAGLSAADNQRIIARLSDPADDLDFDLITEMAKRLTEAVTGRPTGLATA